MSRIWFAVVAMVVGLLLPPGASAQEATAFTLRDINNEQVSLADFEGQVVLLSFWSTWCGPCKEEMPHLQTLYDQLRDPDEDGTQDFVVLSISSDDARTASRVKPFIKKNHYSFPVLLDRQSEVTSVYNPSATLPYTVIIGRDGQVAHTHSGYNPGDEAEVEQHVRELLGIEAQ